MSQLTKLEEELKELLILKAKEYGYGGKLVLENYNIKRIKNKRKLISTLKNPRVTRFPKFLFKVEEKIWILTNEEHKYYFECPDFIEDNVEFTGDWRLE